MKEMRLLFTLDSQNYPADGKPFVRPSARCITIQNGHIAMVYSQKYNYYKFPGGGIQAGETKEQALCRETLEEAGLLVIPSSIKPFGYVRRIDRWKGCEGDFFLQDNFYYLCQVENKKQKQNLDAYEAEEQFTPVWVDPNEAIYANRFKVHGPKSTLTTEREARVLEILLEEGYFC